MLTLCEVGGNPEGGCLEEAIPWEVDPVGDHPMEGHPTEIILLGVVLLRGEPTTLYVHPRACRLAWK